MIVRYDGRPQETPAQAQVPPGAEERIGELERQLQHFQDERARYEQRFMLFTTSPIQNYLTSADMIPPRVLQENLAARQNAERRAFELLEQHIGRDAAAAIQNGGAYPVHSALWEDVI
mgnify:FL=1